MRRPDLTTLAACVIVSATFGFGTAQADEKRIEYRYPDRPDMIYTESGAYRAADPNRPMAFSAFENAVSVADARSVMGKPNSMLQTEAPRRVQPSKSFASSGLTSTAVVPGPAYEPETPAYVEQTPYSAPEFASHSFSIQAGAFSSVSNADRLAAQLASFGDTRVTEGASNGRMIYRVMLGGWNTRSEAQPTLNLIKSRGYEGFVTDAG